jgi:hypothetical protein
VRVHPREAAAAELVALAVVEDELKLALVDEVELLLLVVKVTAGLDSGRKHHRVHAEGGHAERRPDLAEAGTLAQVVQVADGITLASHDFAHGGPPRWWVA